MLELPSEATNDAGPPEAPKPNERARTSASDDLTSSLFVTPSLADSPASPLALVDVTAECSWTAEALTARAAAAGAPVWLDGDELTFFYRAAAGSVRLCCGIQMDMHQVAQSDVWALTVQQAELPRAIVSYTFFVDDRPPIGETMAVWRGPLAPSVLPQADYNQLQGTVRTERLSSAALGEEREVTVYLPPGHNATARYPTIYAADGESAGWLARMLEPHILGGALPPLLVVGAHSGESERRAEEYLPSHGSARFALHERFFVEELAAWAERELAATTERGQRAVFGFSNGGVFAGEMALRHPDHFGIAFPFSAGYTPDTTLRPPDASVRVYLAAGLFEEGFYTSTRSFAQQLEQAGATVVFNPRVAGHDAAMWEEEFATAALWAFGITGNSQ